MNYIIVTDKNWIQKKRQVWKKLKISIELVINEVLGSEEDRCMTDKNPEVLLMRANSQPWEYWWSQYLGAEVWSWLCPLHYCQLSRKNSLFTCIQSKKLLLYFCKKVQQKQIIDEQGSCQTEKEKLFFVYPYVYQFSYREKQN